MNKEKHLVGDVTGKGEKCFACDRALKKAYWADTRDAQMVYVGPDCLGKVLSAGEAGYQPPLGGPRLYEMKYST